MTRSGSKTSRSKSCPDLRPLCRQITNEERGNDVPRSSFTVLKRTVRLSPTATTVSAHLSGPIGKSHTSFPTRIFRFHTRLRATRSPARLTTGRITALRTRSDTRPRGCLGTIHTSIHRTYGFPYTRRARLRNNTRSMPILSDQRHQPNQRKQDYQIHGLFSHNPYPLSVHFLFQPLRNHKHPERKITLFEEMSKNKK